MQNKQGMRDNSTEEATMLYPDKRVQRDMLITNVTRFPRN